jgi:cytoskeletal protein RodZ
MADFGAQLREARERKGISLRQIAASTKISVAALERLERNDVSKLPGGIFSRAFVRSYAAEVGLDPDETVKHFLERFGGELSDSAPTFPSAPVLRPAGAGRSSGAYGGSRDAPALTDEVDFESKQRMASVVLKLVLVSVPVAAALIYYTSRGSAPPPQASEPLPTESAAAAVAEAEATEPAPPPATRPEAGLVPAVSQETPVTSSTEAGAPLRLEIAPTADCWVRLTLDGEVAVARVIAAGERETREFREAALLQVGNAGACAIAINGQPTKPLGTDRQVREVRVTRENYRSFLR